MPKKQLTRSDLKLRFYALMYGCSTPMDIIAAVDFIEESYNLDEGAKEYLASVLERANTMKVPTGTGKLSSIQQPSDDELWRVYKKFWQDYAENWNRALHTGEVLVINGVKNKEIVTNLHGILKLDRDEEFKVVPKSTQSYGRSSIPTDDEITKAYNER